MGDPIKEAAMAANRAALPKPPAYARGLRRMLRNRQAEVLFREAKERGIGCVSCDSIEWCPLAARGSGPMFLCNEWEPQRGE